MTEVEKKKDVIIHAAELVDGDDKTIGAGIIAEGVDAETGEPTGVGLGVFAPLTMPATESEAEQQAAPEASDANSGKKSWGSTNAYRNGYDNIDWSKAGKA